VTNRNIGCQEEEEEEEEERGTRADNVAGCHSGMALHK